MTRPICTNLGAMGQARSRTLRFRRESALLLVGLCCIGPEIATAQDVYKRTDREGRTVYTNAGNVTVDGQPLEVVDLKGLTQADLSNLETKELVLVDKRIESLLGEYQAGERCEQIRSASRGSTRLTFLKEHLRELLVAVSLLVFGFALANLYRVRWVQFVLPLPPILGALFLTFTAYQRSRAATDDLHTALRACSSALPEAEADTPEELYQRQNHAENLREAIDRVAGKLTR